VTRNLVTLVAGRLMEATASTAVEVTQEVLASLVALFDADAGFLRFNDHNAGASKLVAEWPPRRDRPDPDPLAVVEFSSADPVFAYCAYGKRPVVFRPDPAHHTYQAYQRAAAESRRVRPPSVAALPLVSRGVTIGMLGFVKFGGRRWKPKLVNTLGGIASLFAQFQARIAAEEKLRYLAEHDDLTGLHNRRSLVAHLSDRLAPGRPGPVAVLYLDLDRLKSINDYFGHAAGDRYLRVAAERIQATVGDRSLIGRYGGDEFIVVPDQTMPTETAESLAHTLRTSVRDRLEIGNDVITPSVSIGVAAGTPGSDNAADLLRCADEAVLAAKRAGGNQVAVFSDEMSLEGLSRDDVELHLQAAIDSDALLLHYLPEVDLRTGEIVGAEALARWQHPTRGLLRPDSFIGVAESGYLAAELGRWVMRSACAEFSRWQSHGLGTNATLRINVSPRQLVTPDFVPDVADITAECGIDPNLVCLEITERAVVRDIEATRRTLAELKEVGVKIAVDDFGTGYAVLSHLKSLPIDTLKIDKSFVRHLGTNSEDLAIVRAIIGLAEAFGLQLVAEGLETPAAAMTLLRHGCHLAQGFLLSGPVTGDAMQSLLSTHRMPMPFLAGSESLAASVI